MTTPADQPETPPVRPGRQKPGAGYRRVRWTGIFSPDDQDTEITVETFCTGVERFEIWVTKRGQEPRLSLVYKDESVAIESHDIAADSLIIQVPNGVSQLLS